MNHFVKIGGCAALAALLFSASGCATSKPQPQGDYSGILSNRGILPPTMVGTAHHRNVAARPAAPARKAGSDAGFALPSEDDDAFALAPEESAQKPAASGAVAPEAPAKPSAAAMPVAPPDGRQVPDFGGKGGKAATAAGASTYVVQKGDSISRIAHRHGIKTAELLAMNPAVKDASKIQVGQKLSVPGGVKAADSGAAAANGKGDTAAKPGASEKIPADGIYTVAANDSLWTIGRRFGVRRDDIRSWNNLASDKLKVGQMLKLRPDAKLPASAAGTASAANGKAATPPKPAADASPAAPVTPQPAPAAPVAPEGADGSTAVEPPVVTPAPAAPANVIEWSVTDPSDTIETIAHVWNCSVEELLRLNPGIKTNADLKIGTVIKVPVAASAE